MLRLLLSFALAGFIYELYWYSVSRWHGVHSRWIGRSRAEQRLREGGAGYARLVAVWALVLMVYAFGTKAPETAINSLSWLHSIDIGEWFFIAGMAPLLAAAEWYFTSQPASQPPTICEADCTTGLQAEPSHP